MGSDIASNSDTLAKGGFNPRSRMGSDFVSYKNFQVYKQSFNPRSRMGSDAINAAIREAENLRFNPRSRMGSDVLLGLGVGVNDVSTHAPAWGATTGSR